MSYELDLDEFEPALENAGADPWLYLLCAEMITQAKTDIVSRARKSRRDVLRWVLRVDRKDVSYLSFSTVAHVLNICEIKLGHLFIDCSLKYGARPSDFYQAKKNLARYGFKSKEYLYDRGLRLANERRNKKNALAKSRFKSAKNKDRSPLA